MKHRSNTAARFALTGVALAAALWGSQAWALGLGRLNVQSALGETLRAEIEITSITPEEASSLRLRVAPPEVYRAQGVEYNAALAGAQVQIVRRPDGRSVVTVRSDRAVLEPFVDVIVEATWSSGRLVREYTMLFDPPSTRMAQQQQQQQPAQAPSTAPVMTPAPSGTPVPPATAAAPSPASPPVAAAPAPRSRQAAPAPAAPRAAAPSSGLAGGSGGGADEVTVRQGDTLFRIAGRNQRTGVSLDQMLVALFRANPQAFMGENMNRLKSGVVLSVPSAEEAARIAAGEARETIVAQSNDFSAYRQRLAAGTTTMADSAPSRQATGRVQAQVDDRKQAAAASPDKLTLSQGGVKAGAPEAQASKQAERKDSSTRLAELNRNVEELKKLQGATAVPAPAPTPAPAVAAAPATAAAPPAAAPAPTPATPPAPPPAAAATPPAPAPAPVAAAPAPEPAAAPPAPAPTPAPVAAAPKPPAVPAAPEASWLDSVLENPLLLPGAGVLVALLAGLGLYRLRGRMRKQGGETSFLESRLQPDSFFGASGGQRIDTREAASSQGSSSMSYSLSQLDAIGDVDPVAEADVYLAYGRDLQAEEILKEAMRATPERMAIRIKLLEVYAKRRDLKGFELLASQVHNLTRGEGEDWDKVQQLGQSIDPDNVLYHPGGRPDTVIGGAGQPVEALGASTVPYTAPVNPVTFQPAPDATLDSTIDLDLDLGGSKPAPATAAGHNVDFDLQGSTVPVTVPATRREPRNEPRTEAMPPRQQSSSGPDSGLDFDLGDLATAASPTPPAKAESKVDFGEFAIGGESIPSASGPASTAGNGHGGEGGDPLARKLDLAEEFRQIGDLEGARDLLEEVVAKADGALRSKAQAMLDQLH